jgi:hypothetical protein
MVNCMPLCGVFYLNEKGNLMTKKTAKRKPPKIDETPVTPPDGFAKTMDLRFIDGQLHQKYESAHPGENSEHWQPIEAWETDSDGEMHDAGALA